MDFLKSDGGDKDLGAISLWNGDPGKHIKGTRGWVKPMKRALMEELPQGNWAPSLGHWVSSEMLCRTHPTDVPPALRKLRQ